MSSSLSFFVQRASPTAQWMLAFGLLRVSRRHRSWFLAFTAFVGLNLFQSGITGFCLPSFLLKKLGVPEGNGACSR